MNTIVTMLAFVIGVITGALGVAVLYDRHIGTRTRAENARLAERLQRIEGERAHEQGKRLAAEGSRDHWRESSSSWRSQAIEAREEVRKLHELARATAVLVEADYEDPPSVRESDARAVGREVARVPVGVHDRQAAPLPGPESDE